jgi:hypothetical protein
VQMNDDNSVTVMKLMIGFHASEPVIANMVILAVVFTPMYVATLAFLSKQKKMQIEGKKHLMTYQLRKSNSKGRGK